MLKKPEAEPASRLNWVFWWRIDRDEVNWQVAHYSELSFRDSFKGWSAILLSVSAAFSTALNLISQGSRWNYADPVLMLILAAFVLFGHRWAMLTAMVYWTIAKIEQFIGNPLTIVIGLFWWAAFLHAFFMAFVVERRRRSPSVDVDAF